MVHQVNWINQSLQTLHIHRILYSWGLTIVFQQHWDLLSFSTSCCMGRCFEANLSKPAYRHTPPIYNRRGTVVGTTSRSLRQDYITSYTVHDWCYKTFGDKEIATIWYHAALCIPDCSGKPPRIIPSFLLH